MAERKKTRYEKAIDNSDNNDPKNPNAGVKNGKRAKKVTGTTPGKTEKLPLRDDLVEASADEQQVHKGGRPAMSPRVLGAAITQSAKQAKEAAVGPFRWAAQNAGAANNARGTGMA